jgi:hypothetical protein
MHGIHPAALYRLVEDAHLARLARGFYKLSFAQELSNPDAGLRVRTPPVKVYRFDVATFDQGIEIHRIDAVPHFARARKRIVNREILHFARLLRQDRVMAPYLESVT